MGDYINLDVRKSTQHLTLFIILFNSGYKTLYLAWKEGAPNYSHRGLSKLAGGQGSLFELDEDDEVGDGHGDGAGERAPVHGEQPVPGHRLQLLDVPQQLPRGLLADPPLQVLGSSPQVPQAGVQIVDLEKEKL